MPTTNDRISLLNDTDDVTAVKAPPPGLIRESKAMPAAGSFPVGAADDDGPPTPAPVVTPAKPAAGTAHPSAARGAPRASRSPAIGKPTTPASPPPISSSLTPNAFSKPIAAKPLDAKSAAANAATTMAAVASTSGPAAKPRLTGKTLAPPPLARPLASTLTPPSPAAAKPEILGPTPPAGLPTLGSGALPLTRPTTALAITVAPKPKAELLGPTPPAGLPALGSGALPLLRPTTALSTAIPRERRPPTPAAGSAREILDLSQVSSSGPLLAPKPGAWSTRTSGERSRLALYGAAAALVVAAIIGIGWKQWWSARPGRIEISSTPSGATVMLGGDPAPHHAPVAFEKPPGRYTISVTRDGFQHDDRTIDLHAGQEVVLSIALAAAEANAMAIVPEPTDGAHLGGVNGARRGVPGSPGAARPSMARPIAHLDAAFAARTSARATALANAMRSDEADPPVMEATIPAPGTAPVTAPAPGSPSSETAPPLPGGAPKTDSPGATVPASATAPAPATKAEPFEKSSSPSDEIAGARTISGRLAKALLIIDSNADEYRVKAPPSLARAEMKLSAVVKMCVNAQGRVADVKLLKSADPAIDAQIPAVLGKWRYKPLVTGGRAVPFCYVLQYEIASP